MQRKDRKYYKSTGTSPAHIMKWSLLTESRFPHYFSVIFVTVCSMILYEPAVNVFRFTITAKFFSLFFFFSGIVVVSFNCI